MVQCSKRIDRNQHDSQLEVANSAFLETFPPSSSSDVRVIIELNRSILLFLRQLQLNCQKQQPSSWGHVHRHSHNHHHCYPRHCQLNHSEHHHYHSHHHHCPVMAMIVRMAAAATCWGSWSNVSWHAGSPSSTVHLGFICWHICEFTFDHICVLDVGIFVNSFLIIFVPIFIHSYLYNNFQLYLAVEIVSEFQSTNRRNWNQVTSHAKWWRLLLWVVVVLSKLVFSNWYQLVDPTLCCYFVCF